MVVSPIMVEAVAQVIIAGRQLGSLETKPDYFKLQWSTSLPNGELFQRTREFLATLKDTLGDEPATVESGKAFPPSIMILDSEGKGEVETLEDFMDEQKFSARIGKISAVYLRMNTSYGDIMMDLEGKDSEGSIHVASHLDLSVPLAKFVVQTHEDRLPAETEPEILAILSENLMQYR